MSVNESTWRFTMGTREVLISCVCFCNGLYQQQEWDCSLGGLTVQVPEAGETGVHEHLLCRQSVWSQLLERSTPHLCTFILSPVDSHLALPERKKDDAIGTVYVFVSDVCACLCIYGYTQCMSVFDVCLLRTHLQPHCWSDLRVLEYICLTSLQLLNIFSSNRNYTVQINQRKTTEVKEKHQEPELLMPFHSTLTHTFLFSTKDFVLAFTFVRNDRWHSMSSLHNPLCCGISCSLHKIVL